MELARNNPTFQLLLAVVLATHANSAASEFDVLFGEISTSPQASWTAEIPARFADFEAVKSTCGTIILEGAMPSEEFPEYKQSGRTDFPTSFDARTTWPACPLSIGHVGDQAECGSCWAFSSTHVYEAGLCIRGGEDLVLSKADTAGCCSGALCGYSKSCVAGTPHAAFMWMTRYGVVSGGDYDSSDGCTPYVFAPCNINPGHPSPLPDCVHATNEIECASSCGNANYNKSYVDDKHTQAGQGVGLNYRDDNQSHIMDYIMEHGPVSAAFTVMEDFPLYSSGVYHHVTGKALGGHAVTMIGWGEEANATDPSAPTTPYWLVKNSWSPTWGKLGGYFKIRRGTNEAGIEGQVYGLEFTSPTTNQEEKHSFATFVDEVTV